MAFVNFKKGLRANLPSAITAGTFYVTTDERAIYLDVNDSTRIRIGDFQEFATLAELQANTNPNTTSLYYVADINCLAKYNGTEYVQINRDTGATSFEVIGDGNAITAVAYDATGRKLTLTKGATFATPGDVDTKISAAVGDLGNDTEGNAYANVKAYVDAKTSGIATDAALGELQSDVTDLEGKVTNLETAIGEGGSVETQIDNKIAELKLDETYEKVGVAATEAGKVQTALDEYKTSNDAAVKAAADAAKAAQDDIDALEAVAATHALTSDLTTEVNRAKAAEEANAAVAKAADDKAVAAQDDVDALAEKVGEVAEGKTVVQMIEDAQTAATYDDTQVKADIAANAEAIQAEKERMDAFMTLEDGQTLNAALDSLKEIQDFITNEAADADVLLGKVSALEAIVAGIGGEGEPATVVAYVTAAIEALKIGDYAKAADLTALADRVAAMEAKVPNWDAAEQNAKDYADALNTTMNTRVEALEAIDHDHANKAELDKIFDGDVAKWNAAQANAEATAAAALAGAKTELEGKITASQAAAEKVANDNNAAMDTRVKVLEAIDHNAYVAADAQVLADAKAHANGLASNYDAAGSAATAEANAKAHTETMLTWGEF